MIDFCKSLDSLSYKISSEISDSTFYKAISSTILKKSLPYYPLNGGKRLRPALAVWSCGLFGGVEEKILPIAAGIEIFHNWSLVHDDIIDNDTLRRNKPTCHSMLSSMGSECYNLTEEEAIKFGRDFAILTGDLLLSWSISMMLESINYNVSCNVVLSIVNDLTNKATRDLIAGEGLDVEFSYRDIEGISLRDIERMIYLKTGALIEFSVVAGAKVALGITDHNDKRILPLVNFSRAIGLAFQLKDDWLGVFGDRDVFGKNIASDIVEKKPTYMFISTLNLLKDNKKRVFLNILRKKSVDNKDIETVRSLIRDSGAERAILDKISTLHREAERSLLSLPENEYRDLLCQLNCYLLERKR